MTRDKCVQSFFLKYKKCHKTIELELTDVNNNEYIASRILDKIIIYLFIKENFKNIETYEFNLDNYEGSSLWMKLLNFYENLLNISNADLNILKFISKNINDSVIEENVHISDNTMNAIFKELSKFKLVLNDNVDNSSKYISPDILGDVFEKYLNQKDSGAYYTENDVIRYINQNSLVLGILNKIEEKKELISSINSQLKSEKINKLEDLLRLNINPLQVVLDLITCDNSNIWTKKILIAINDLKLIDLTCGTGGFLVDAVKIIYKIKMSLYIKMGESKSSSKIIVDIIENNIFGIDIMNDAINLAKFRLLLLVLKYSSEEPSDLSENITFNLISANVLSPDFKLNKKNISDFNLNEVFNIDSATINFINTINNGGFDCTIGNPPYIEYSKVKNQYPLDEFKTFNCKNIYAYVIERNVDILKEGGILGLIVPISIVSTPRMHLLRDLLSNKFCNLFYSNFADRPGTLFNGVHQKNSIIIGIKDSVNTPVIYTTRYNHWYKEEKTSLFNNIKYIENKFLNTEYYPKIGCDIDISILNKINNIESSIDSITDSNGEYTAYLNDRMCFWVKCFGDMKISNSFKKIAFKTEDEKWIYVALMNSSMFYYLWCIISDGWHITKKEVDALKFNYNKLSKTQRYSLINLAKKLEIDLENNKEFINSKQVSYEYKHKKSKSIIDKIDFILKEYYKLDEEEYNHIIYYNLKYRMNDELESYLKTLENKNLNKEMK